MLQSSKTYLTLILALFLLSSCIKKTDTEEEMPQVELLFPAPCDTLYFGDTMQFRMKVADNSGLGNISMDVHHNFGHHSHGDHETCNMDDPKDAVNPYSESWYFTLPSDKNEHIFESPVAFPAMQDDTTYFDTGDYHFHIYVTDNDGYQVFTTMDVKVLYR